jgi:hypothetical protein
MPPSNDPIGDHRLPERKKIYDYSFELFLTIEFLTYSIILGNVSHMNNILIRSISFCGPCKLATKEEIVTLHIEVISDLIIIKTQIY